MADQRVLEDEDNNKQTADGNVIMDCTNPKKNKFSRKFKVLLYIAIFYTGVCTLAEVWRLGVLINGGPGLLWDWSKGESINAVLWENVVYIIMILFFIALLKITTSKKPFSNLLIKCFYAAGIILIAGAVLFPLLPAYTMPNFISGREGGYYIDGLPLTVGILIIIVGKVIKYGYEYQKEMDETI